MILRKQNFLFSAAAIFAAFLFAGEIAAADNGAKISDIFIGGKDGYHTYRLPIIIVTNRGTLLAFCEGRTNSPSDTGNVDMLVKRSTDGGRTWSKQQLIWEDGENKCGTPCAVVDRETGTIWLLMCWNLGRDNEHLIINQKSKDTRRVYLTSSTDDGLTWQRPVEITSDVKKPNWTHYATGPGNGIQLTRGPHKGRLVVPCDHVEAGTRRGYSHVIYSDDHGESWQIGGSGPLGTNESAVVELADGRLMLNMRNYLPWRRLEEPRRVCFSSDGGLTWRDHYQDKTLVEPVCQASILRYTWPGDDVKSRILFCNPASKWRVNLTVRMSYDEGRTWPVSRVLHAGSSAYSSLAVSSDGEIFCLFENGAKAYYEKISLAWFRLE